MHVVACARVIIFLVDALGVVDGRCELLEPPSRQLIVDLYRSQLDVRRVVQMLELALAAVQWAPVVVALDIRVLNGFLG